MTGPAVTPVSPLVPRPSWPASTKWIERAVLARARNTVPPGPSGLESTRDDSAPSCCPRHRAACVNRRLRWIRCSIRSDRRDERRFGRRCRCEPVPSRASRDALEVLERRLLLRVRIDDDSVLDARTMRSRRVVSPDPVRSGMCCVDRAWRHGCMPRHVRRRSARRAVLRSSWDLRLRRRNVRVCDLWRRDARRERRAVGMRGSRAGVSATSPASRHALYE